MAAASARYFDLISGKRRGLPAEIARAGLSLLSLPYLCGIAVRNAYYGIVPGAAHRLNRPVISIGNITTGGTGKTPMAAAVANLLAARGRRVAILLRGYGAAAIEYDEGRPDRAAQALRTASDEAMVLKRLCPAADIHMNPDRLSAAGHAVSRGADVLVLDDGFQHRRLARDLDIVLVDATAPFGGGRLLPRGLLREPMHALKRAGLIVLTRSDQVDEAARARILSAVRRAAGDKPVVQAAHRIRGMLDLKGRPAAVEDWSSIQAVVFAGIGNFEGFRGGVEATGIRIAAAYQFPDHHDYTTDEIEGLQGAAGNLEANAILTTEKDAVKLIGRWPAAGMQPLALNLEIEFLEDGEAVLREALEQAIERGNVRRMRV